MSHAILMLGVIMAVLPATSPILLSIVVLGHLRCPWRTMLRGVSGGTDRSWRCAVWRRLITNGVKAFRGWRASAMELYLRKGRWCTPHAGVNLQPCTAHPDRYLPQRGNAVVRMCRPGQSLGKTFSLRGTPWNLRSGSTSRGCVFPRLMLISWCYLVVSGLMTSILLLFHCMFLIHEYSTSTSLY